MKINDEFSDITQVIIEDYLDITIITISIQQKSYKIIMNKSSLMTKLNYGNLNISTILILKCILALDIRVRISILLKAGGV